MKYTVGKKLLNIKKSYVQKINEPYSHDYEIYDDIILGKKNNQWVGFDTFCDHNGGRLYLDVNKKTATCPMHKWTLIMDKERYENNCFKKPLEINQVGKILEIKREVVEFNNPDTSCLIDAKIQLDFNAHASVTCIINGLTITTDPWLVGSCFASGWWHAYPPSQEAVTRLINSDLIYISHNHPDHLHIQTLNEFVAKDKLILVPNFESKSVESILRLNGFTNLIVLDFLTELILHSSEGQIKLVLVGSGDDRDDSSLLLATKENQIFFGVDTNMPNRLVLPKVDILFTSFAGGASGFPSRIENFSHQKKQEIIFANKASMLNNHVRQLISAMRPKYVIPYAGYFTESPKDNDVKLINIKNSPEDLENFIVENFRDVKCINPIVHGKFSFYKEKVEIETVDEVPLYFIDDKYIASEMKKKSNISFNDTDLALIGKAFLNSKFTDDLSVILIPSNDDFSIPVSKGLHIDFSLKNRSFDIFECFDLSNDDIQKKIHSSTKNNLEILRIRSSSFADVLEAGAPFEDLSIGFQVKMYRFPNVYNFNFWSYFTNVEFIKI